MKVYTNNGGNPKDFEKMQHTLYGPQYSNDEVLEVLKKFNLSYEKPEEIEKDAAKLIADGKIIGWFQGRMEAGKRALGDRSILADPRSIELKDLVNDKVKFRESWRPFCPSLLSEKVRNYLDKPYDAPFMILAFDLKKDKLNKVPGIVHVDGTIRPQLVKKEINPKYWKLIKEFENVTGEAILLNTSFNIKGEPIVCSPEDAVNCFLKTGIDVLVINDYLIKTK
jgi:carbamoyltransferase